MIEKLVIVKLGGSVITYKKLTPPQVNRKTIERIAQELKVYRGPLIIILGGGSFGHQAAKEAGFDNQLTVSSTLFKGIPKIRHNMFLLSLQVETIFSAANLSPVVIPPFCIATLDGGKISSFNTETIENCLQAGLTVILHGDVCFDKKRGAAILSGDTIISWVGKYFGATRILVGTDVDGVYECDPHQNPNASLLPVLDIEKLKTIQVGPSKSTDVTGGMLRKISDLFDLLYQNTDVRIFNLAKPGRLKKLLLGEPVPCTRIVRQNQT